MTPIAIPRVARGHHGFEHHHQRIYLIDIALAPGSGCKKSDSQWRPPVFDYISKKSRSCRIYLGSMQMITNLPYAWHILGDEHPWAILMLKSRGREGTMVLNGIDPALGLAERPLWNQRIVTVKTLSRVTDQPTSVCSTAYLQCGTPQGSVGSISPIQQKI